MSQAPDRTGGPSAEEIAALDAHWRAANYLAVGQIYLMDNPCSPAPSPPRTSSPGCSGTGAPRRG